MHNIQQKLLELAEKKNLGNLTLREIGGFVGETSPQKIKHHLQQLEKHGFIHINKMEHTITTTKQQGTRHEGNIKERQTSFHPDPGRGERRAGDGLCQFQY